jgi:hypothetical protein
MHAIVAADQLNVSIQLWVLLDGPSAIGAHIGFTTHTSMIHVQYLCVTGARTGF